MKKIMALLLLLTLYVMCIAQPNPIGNPALLEDHLKRTEYDLDSNAAAVVLYEKGTYELWQNAYRLLNTESTNKCTKPSTNTIAN